MATVAQKVSTIPPAVLFERIRAGDEEAFNQLHTANHARVLAAVKRYIPESDTAEYIANGVFMKVWEVRNRASGFKNRSAFTTWLTRVAYNAALMHLRASRTENKYASYSMDAPKITDGGGIKLPDFPVRDLNLEGIIDRKALADAIVRLPVSYRMVFIMRLVEGRSIRECSQTLNLKSNTVKARLFRSKQMLREFLRGNQAQ